MRRIKDGSLLCTVFALFSAYEAAHVLSPPSLTDSAKEGAVEADLLNHGFINKHLYPKPDEVTIKCKMLTSKRLFYDGTCTSSDYVVERVCAGRCHPERQENKSWWGEYLKYWHSQYVKHWKCKEGKTRRQRIKLLCPNGTIRTYKIRVVKTCNCVQYSKKDNESKSRKRRPRRKRRRHRTKKRRGQGRKNKNNRKYLNSNSPEL
ncbi:sclerostin domain-containing protein 1-like [Mizuhopecten yessoensis]|uniref:sclerostin domain-containing protein 1-like n=1 Tax=Mizuhopecten yessoensis TaxID=6573 RepID=UPI000B45F860|nr:sclerostin domain-containing protein 1-like [Mizuhopecten yessoensis]